MKKFYSLLLTMLLTVSAMACDVCGSGPGNYYNGLLPVFHRFFIGLRYQQSHLQTHLGPDGRVTYLSSKERYSVMELWGGISFSKRFRLMFSLPYTSIQRKTISETEKESGPGDINLVGYYQLITPKKESTFAQSLWLGAGIKLPTGRYDNNQENIGLGLQNNFQLGSKSTDFSLNLMYDISYRNTGIDLNMAYRFNSVNKFQYKYGDRLTTNLLFYQRVALAKNIYLTPNTGLMFESGARDEKAKGISVWNSGGHASSFVAGMECSLGRINIGVNFQDPFSQRIAEKRVKMENRVMAYLSYSFP
ncbi:MAG: transporter [Chitinophagaceae bacterium]